MTKNEKILREHILTLSVSSVWEEAIKEWGVHSFYFGCHTCSCSKPNIKYVVIIYNTLTKHTTVVGSSCVTKFMGIPTKYLFSELKCLQENNLYILEGGIVSMIHDRGCINDWELSFYTNVSKVNKELSEKQNSILAKINNRILNYLK